jgi:hypothetical protein
MCVRVCVRVRVVDRRSCTSPRRTSCASCTTDRRGQRRRQRRPLRQRRHESLRPRTASAPFTTSCSTSRCVLAQCSSVEVGVSARNRAIVIARCDQRHCLRARCSRSRSLPRRRSVSSASHCRPRRRAPPRPLRRRPECSRPRACPSSTQARSRRQRWAARRRRAP